MASDPSEMLTSMLKEPMDLAQVLFWSNCKVVYICLLSYQYLFARLHQAGVKSVFGVPGDYNLMALDYVLKEGLTWVGDCNELNAGK